MDGIFEVGDEVSVKLLDVDKQGKLKFRAKHYCQTRSILNELVSETTLINRFSGNYDT
jgi:predicted RNA-binding protein with RPS1 domain